MAVFDDCERTDASPSRHGESWSAFLTRVDGRFWDDIRELIEDWFSRLCPDACADVRARLRSNEDRVFHGAFLELYIHESLLRAGYTVTCHPSVAGTARRPDFLAERGEESFYIEARAISASDGTVAAGRRLSVVYDALNTLDSPDFFLWLDVESQGEAGLPTRPLRKKLKEWLSTLDPDAVSASVAQRGLESAPVLDWKTNGWHLRLRPISKSAAARGSNTGLRPLGVFGPGRARMVDDMTPIREALVDKGSAYGELGRPYIVALSISSISTDDEDVISALYGSERLQVGISDDGDSVTRSLRDGDGYWLGGTEWRHRRVSGVLVGFNLHAGLVATNVPTLWLHPEPSYPLTSPPPMWRQMTLSAGELQPVDPVVQPRDLFHLPTPWPAGERFADDQG